MEPMAVSPGKSPTQSGQYLPSFLLGELSSPCSGGQSSSPYTPSTNYTSRGSRTKLEGPPIVGLFDEVTSSTSVHTPNNNPSLHTSVHNASTTFLDSSCLEIQENANFWVVVYGFPPAQVSQILSLFSQMGRVAESNYPVNANWVCICYTNRADMRKALSMNGKVLSGNVMIGVTERKIQVGSENCSIGVGSPVNSSLANGSISSPTSPKIRPLAISKRHNTQLVNQDRQTICFWDFLDCRESVGDDLSEVIYYLSSGGLLMVIIFLIFNYNVIIRIVISFWLNVLFPFVTF